MRVNSAIMESSFPSSSSSPVHDLCNAAVDYVLQHVNTIQFIIQSIEQITGEKFTRDRIKCVSSSVGAYNADGEIENRLKGVDSPKSVTVSAGYMWRSMGRRSEIKGKEVRKGDIVLLEDLFLPSLRSQEKVLTREYVGGPFTVAVLEKSMSSVLHQVEKNLRHELIHAFDDARGEINPWNCLHQACSEIRAARLSGDCFTGEEVRNWRFNFFRSGKNCVRRLATLAVETNPLCRGFAERAVEKVFPQCYFDYEPFVAPIYVMGSHGEDVFPNGTLPTTLESS